jgi:hypothetical protein
MLSWAGMFCVQEARNKLGKKKYGGWEIKTRKEGPINKDNKE